MHTLYKELMLYGKTQGAILRLTYSYCFIFVKEKKGNLGPKNPTYWKINHMLAFTFAPITGCFPSLHWRQNY